MIINNLIFQKDKGNTDYGFVYVNFRLNKKQIRVSTTYKMSKAQFDNYRNPEFPEFNPTREIPYVNINDKIRELLNTNPFVDSSDIDFLVYFENYIGTIQHGGTRKLHKAIYNRLCKYFNSILYTSLDDAFLLRYYRLLSSERKDNGKRLSDGYIRMNFIIINSIINVVNIEKRMNVKIDISLLGLAKNKTRKENLLCDQDVAKLMNFTSDTIHLEYATFGLCQLFGSGVRFSDLLFLRFKHFKKDGIEIQQPKTKGNIKIPYSVMLLRTMYKFIYRYSVHTKTEFENFTKFGVANSELVLNGLKANILDYTSKQPREDFFFSFVPKELNSYQPSLSFSPEEFLLFANCRSRYNRGLLSISKRLEFELPLSSHAFRYKFVANCIEQKVSIYEISKCLNHSSIAVTENYIKKNFTIYDSREVSNLVDKKYLS